MKASELVKRLQELMEKHGDNDVMFWEFKDGGADLTFQRAKNSCIEVLSKEEGKWHE